MKWHFNDERPIYQQIVEQLEMAVIIGEYKAGEKLPGVRELALQASVNPNTMQRAMSELESKGLFYSQRTAGRFVIDDAEKIRLMRAEFAKKITAEYIENITKLGFRKQDIINIIEEIGT